LSKSPQRESDRARLSSSQRVRLRRVTPDHDAATTAAAAPRHPLRRMTPEHRGHSTGGYARPRPRSLSQLLTAADRTSDRLVSRRRTRVGSDELNRERDRANSGGDVREAKAATLLADEAAHTSTGGSSVRRRGWLARLSPASSTTPAASSSSAERSRVLVDFTRDLVQLHEVLGAGPLSTVYRGTLHGLTVAVKSVRVRYATSVERERLIERLALFESLAHDNVARHFGHTWHAATQQCLVFMEYYAETLRTDLDRRHRLLHASPPAPSLAGTLLLRSPLHLCQHTHASRSLSLSLSLALYSIGCENADAARRSSIDAVRNFKNHCTHCRRPCLFGTIGTPTLAIYCSLMFDICFPIVRRSMVAALFIET
jgi:hypothetical protein